MAKVKLTFENRKDIFLYMTRVENLFINEFLPDAPGDYVKVYLFGLMYAQFEQSLDSRGIARSLGISEADTEEAWIYWETRGIVRRHKETGADGAETEVIEFVRQIEALYGKVEDTSDKVQAGSSAEGEAAAAEEGSDVPFYVSIDDMEYDRLLADKVTDKRLRETYDKYQEATGRTISRQETGRISDAIKVYGIEPDLFDYAIEYCAGIDKYSVDYIFKVAMNWSEEGCETPEDAKKLLEKQSQRNSWYSQVFRALGFTRMPAPADKEMMDRWFDGLKLSIGEVLDACRASAGLRDPNLKYVNKVLENRMLEKGGVNTRAEKTVMPAAQIGFDEGSPVSKKVLADYYKYIRTQEENAQKQRMREAVQKIPSLMGLFEEETKINRRMFSVKPGEEGREEKKRLRAERQAVENRKKELLEEAGFTEDWLNRRYRCTVCRDSGYTDEGRVCSCCRERAKEAYKWIGEQSGS